MPIRLYVCVCIVTVTQEAMWLDQRFNFFIAIDSKMRYSGVRPSYAITFKRCTLNLIALCPMRQLDPPFALGRSTYYTFLNTPRVWLYFDLLAVRVNWDNQHCR